MQARIAAVVSKISTSSRLCRTQLSSDGSSDSRARGANLEFNESSSELKQIVQPEWRLSTSSSEDVFAAANLFYNAQLVDDDQYYLLQF